VKRSISQYFKADVETKETEESGSDNKIIYGIPRRNKKLRNFRETSADYEEVYVAKDSEKEEEDDVFPSTEENQNQEKDKSYVRCKVCQKVMRRKSYQQHKQKHDGEDRKFGCSYCETKFRKSEHLQEHMKRFHEQSR